MIFNALGEIIKWIFVHDGTYLPDTFTIDNAIDVSSLKTSDGLVSSHVLVSAIIYVKRYYIKC